MFSTSLPSQSLMKLPLPLWSSQERVNWLEVHVPALFHRARQLAEALEMEASSQQKI